MGLVNEVEKLATRADRADDERGILRERIGSTNEKLARIEEKLDTAKHTADKIDDECAKAEEVKELKRRVNWLIGLLGMVGAGLIIDLAGRGIPT